VLTIVGAARAAEAFIGSWIAWRRTGRNVTVTRYDGAAMQSGLGVGGAGTIVYRQKVCVETGACGLENRPDEQGDSATLTFATALLDFSRPENRSIDWDRGQRRPGIYEVSADCGIQSMNVLRIKYNLICLILSHSSVDAR